MVYCRLLLRLYCCLDWRGTHNTTQIQDCHHSVMRCELVLLCMVFQIPRKQHHAAPSWSFDEIEMMISQDPRDQTRPRESCRRLRLFLPLYITNNRTAASYQQKRLCYLIKCSLPNQQMTEKQRLAKSQRYTTEGGRGKSKCHNKRCITNRRIQQPSKFSIFSSRGSSCVPNEQLVPNAFLGSIYRIILQNTR